MTKPIILSLFDFSGNWPRYFRNDFRVIQVDEDKHSPEYPYEHIVADINTWEPEFDSVYGILAAPPCTHLTLACNRLWKQKDNNGQTKQAINLVNRVLYFVDKYNPKFWILENPVGRLPNLIPRLAKYQMIINPCDYAGYSPNPQAERYLKKTCLWGNFKLAPKNSISAGRSISQKIRDPYLRSITPLGLAYATWLGNK